MNPFIKLVMITGVVLVLGACNKASDEPLKTINDPKDSTNNTGGGGGITETGVTLNPDISFVFNGNRIEFSKTQAEYGSKTYLMGFDKNSRFVLDLTLPAAKDIVATGKTFTLFNDQFTGMGMFIDDEDKKWFFEGGTISVSKNTGNLISGTFSGKAIYIDYTDPLRPVRADSTNFSNGVFNNLKVKG